MQLKITTQSYLLAASGEGAALIDSDAVFHSSGFPYLPSRRIKGLLRNSALETLEMISGRENQYTYLIEELFGISGDEGSSAGVKIPNLYLENWNELLTNYEALLSKHKYPLSATNIQSYYTEEIAQTALDGGIAKNGSLRRYRVVKEDVIFETSLITIGLSEAAKALLYLAAVNLRYMGSRRNRGFGKILCAIDMSDMDVEKAIESIRASVKPVNQHQRQEVSSVGNNYSSDKKALKQLALSIRLTSPVMVTRQGADQNTVSTDDYISGSRIRGLIASKIIQHKKLGRNAHLDAFFYQSILSENIQYHHAWLVKNGNTSSIVPRNIQKEKGKNNFPCAFDTFKEKIATGRAAGYLGIKDGNNQYRTVEPAKSAMFHHQRNNRIAGKSEDGNIFYYESLDAGQEFRSVITGREDVLEELVTILGKEFTGTIGRSRSVQYADVTISVSELQDIPVNNVKASNDYLLVCDSPLVLLNEYGMAEPTASVLLANLKAQADIDATMVKAASAYDQHEHYVAVWKGKTPQVPAFKEGSVFWLRFENQDGLTEKLNALQRDGLGEMKALGYGKIALVDYNGDERSAITVSAMNKISESHSFDDPEALPLLQKIINHYNQEDNVIKIKTEAIKKAKSVKPKLTNSLIGRMLLMLAASENIDAFNNDMRKLKDKPAGDALQKENLFEPLQKLADTKTWEKHKAYWSAYFQTVRNNNKKKQSHAD